MVSPLKGLIQLSSLTFVSRILGLIRDWIYAYVFGASAAMDAFLIAFKIPNLFRRLFAEGAFGQALLPILIDCRSHQPEDYQLYVDAMFTRLLSVLLIFSVIGVIAAPVWIWVFAPGYLDDPEQMSLTSQLLRLTFPYILFVSLTAFIAAILNSQHCFKAGAIMPVILNLVLIVSAVFLSTRFDEPIIALAIGVMFAGVVQLVLILRAAQAQQIYVRIRWRIKPRQKAYMSQFALVFLPALLSVGIVQINLIVDMILASTLESGTITWLYLAQRLMELPNGVIIVAISTVAITQFAELHTASRDHDLTIRVKQALELGIALTLPAVIALIIFAEPIIQILFEYGEFNANDRIQTARALQAYTAGLIGFMITKIYTSLAFVKGDTRVALIASCIGVSVNIGLSLVLIHSFQHQGLAIATAIGAWLNGLTLMLLLSKKHLPSIPFNWHKSLWIGLLNGLILSLLVLVSINLSEWWQNQQVWLKIFSLLTLFGMIVVGYALFIFKLKLPLLDAHFSNLNPKFNP